MGLSEDVTSKLSGTVWGHFENSVDDDRVGEAGLDLEDPHLRRVLLLARQLIGLPRHLSQHVGGFILTQGPLMEIVPIGNGAMPKRSFIEWDKDDIEALKIYKLDVLALGMLTCLGKGFNLLRDHKGLDYDLATVPKEHQYPEERARPTYNMLCRGESLGVFQVESRAQMAMLPKLRPRGFYDLVIEVAIVRPGPIQGDMVHPYLKRRTQILNDPKTTFSYPKPGPAYDQMELESILSRTLGVPIFQEQAMKIAMVAAEFSDTEANLLRKAMATFRHRGEHVKNHKSRMVERMIARGYDPEFAARCFSQIEGFGEYGFPESHAASFAKLVYVSAWMKCHHPDVFACALLNSQPMGFYAPAQIVRDARENGVRVQPVDVTVSDWDCTLSRLDECGSVELDGVVVDEKAGTPPVHPPYTPCADTATPGSDGEAGGTSNETGYPAPPSCALRLGFRMIDGMRRDAADRILAARANGPFLDVVDLRQRARLDKGTMKRLAAADAFGSLSRGRRAGVWDAMGPGARRGLPLFDAAGARDVGPEARVDLPKMAESEEVVADYKTTRLSLREHPMSFFRRSMTKQGFTPAWKLWDQGHGAQVRVAGLVLVRQKPGSAKGVCFITLEDETGVINLVIWKDMFAANRGTIMRSRLMSVRGQVQTDGKVIHVVCHEITDRTDALDRLSDDALRPITTRGDHPTNPIAHQVGEMPNVGKRPAVPRTHPRDVRVIPKSRDFH